MTELEILNHNVESIENQIKDKKIESETIKENLKHLKHERWETVKKRNNHIALLELHKFIKEHGNIVCGELHNELRLKLIDIVYKDLYTPDSYDLVLRLILNKLDVKCEYLSENNKKDHKYKMLRIEL